ncbi:hypothetical protein CHGG_02935 [Chaetomium globosum CBS 148.51]|uniref:Uncharacterized protein n=1 Tax=Chaetomium globosum (strain ATCC 6205 / CBS 148.51 / DSM 1962 / NBRC 6347 / NRRL 1970) TaxID=306901 RepID=Q2HA19_CHAGB|nr:uncharacterized protein CHGG_02935 [Chaetomium globosum CBS 148.51]EAQ91000.1 hypothetical protein CHGG_02935 [Chaetomium globosum CBS 148.51]
MAPMHHHRRRSGHISGNSSLTDVRKAVTATDLSQKKYSSRPSMTRRTTPQTVPKLGKNPRDREKELDEQRWWDEERESFPEYCMICEKQFVPLDDQSLYCSEDASISTVSNHYTSSHTATQYPFYSGPPEPRDIIPRASPSRPSSTHVAPPVTPASAMAALKSLSIRPASPTSPVGTYHQGIWPFARSVTAASPGSSYSKQNAGLYASTYDGAYYGGGSDYYGTSSDRPLPSRRPAAYSRPKSIELVTPMLGR